MLLRNVRRLGSRGLNPAKDIEIADDKSGEEMDATGLVLSPGWMDLHAHLRDPGATHKETLRSGTRSAAVGGFTHIVAMANTDPITQFAPQVSTQIDRARNAPIRVSFAAALTVGLLGKDLTNAALLHKAGAIALSDDGRHSMSPKVLAYGLSLAASVGLPVFIHAQYEGLGNSSEAEYAAVADALDTVASVPKGRLHIQHVSSRRTVELIASAKKAGLAVSAEVTPHHLALTAEDVSHLGSRGNVSPPLRSQNDREALVEGLKEGVIDVVATDHAPHDELSKNAGANGFHGFETAIAVLLSLALPWDVLYRALVQLPREIVGQEPHQDDWTLINPSDESIVDPSRFESLGRNTPFAGWSLPGRVLMTWCRQRAVFQSEMQHA